MSESKLQRVLIVTIAVVGFVAIVILSGREDPEPAKPPCDDCTGVVVHGGPGGDPAPETAEPPMAEEDPGFARIRQLVDRRMVAAFEEAASDRKTGVGSALAVAVGKLVLKVVKEVVLGLVAAAIGVLLWKYKLWLAGGFLAAVTVVAAPIGYAGGKAAKPGGKGAT